MLQLDNEFSSGILAAMRCPTTAEPSAATVRYQLRPFLTAHPAAAELCEAELCEAELWAPEIDRCTEGNSWYATNCHQKHKLELS
jgi:hypothetical protein